VTQRNRQADCTLTTHTHTYTHTDRATQHSLTPSYSLSHSLTHSLTHSHTTHTSVYSLVVPGQLHAGGKAVRPQVARVLHALAGLRPAHALHGAAQCSRPGQQCEQQQGEEEGGRARSHLQSLLE
jgi:hypothetical protein